MTQLQLKTVFSLQSWCMISYCFFTTVLGLQLHSPSWALDGVSPGFYITRGIQNQFIETGLLSPQAPHGWEWELTGKCHLHWLLREFWTTLSQKVTVLLLGYCYQFKSQFSLFSCGHWWGTHILCEPLLNPQSWVETIIEASYEGVPWILPGFLDFWQGQNSTESPPAFLVYVWPGRVVPNLPDLSIQ